jgi:hypothetical protein
MFVLPTSIVSSMALPPRRELAQRTLAKAHAFVIMT